jgi:hypothetical protein
MRATRGIPDANVVSGLWPDVRTAGSTLHGYAAWTRAISSGVSSWSFSCAGNYPNGVEFCFDALPSVTSGNVGLNDETPLAFSLATLHQFDFIVRQTVKLID